MKGVPKKHHYIPQFYQRGFTAGNGLLWVYDRKLKTYKQLPPKTICCVEDFYSIKCDSAPQDRQIESTILSHIDGCGADVIRRVKSGEHLDGPGFRELVRYVAFQYTRTPCFRRGIESLYIKNAELMSRIMFATPERAKEAIERYHQDDTVQTTVTPESMVEAVLGEHLQVKVTEAPFLSQLLSLPEKLEPILEASNAEVLIAPENTGFIFCDNPIVAVPPEGFDINCGDGVGIAYPGAIRYFPLTRGLCLRLGEPDFGFRYRRVAREIVRTVNCNVAANSERFIMGSDHAQLQSAVKKSRSQELDPGEHIRVEIVEETKDNGLVKIMVQPRRYFYCLNN
jgi:hypothetical protein